MTITVKKLMQAVKNTLPAIADAMERLRSNMIIFKYQLLHISSGKHRIKQSLNLYREDMNEYIVLADKIKAKSKERKIALTEKKKTPIIHVLKHRDFARRIAELQEQASEFDPAKLYEARLAIRSGHERNSIQRVQDAYGDKYNLLMMFESRRDVGELLNEEMEALSLRERLRQKQQRKKQINKESPNTMSRNGK